MPAQDDDASLNTWQNRANAEEPPIEEPTIRVDSPLNATASPVMVSPMPVRNRSKPRQKPQPKAPAMANGLRFVNIEHPDQLKDRFEMRQNRIHVMTTYLDKARHDPTNTDIRARGPPQARRRNRTSEERQTDGRSNVSSTPSLHLTTPAPAGVAAPLRQQKRSREAESHAQTTSRSDDRRGPLRQMNGNSILPNSSRRRMAAAEDDSPLLKDMTSIYGKNGYFAAALDEIPGSMNLSTLGAELQPFNAWPTLASPKLDLNHLKYSCGSQFASVGLITHWLPTLLQAQPAFLSTICISASHDDIMRRGSVPVHERSPHESKDRMLVRGEVMQMINKVMKDPQQQTTDATIVAVLHLLNSEIMGCDGSAMKRHQAGLHAMVLQRGGLVRLGIHGQLSSMLTITNYLISALRETEPLVEYSFFASQKRVEPPEYADKYPVSPVYCPRSGFSTLRRSLKHPQSTYTLLEDIRLITSAFVRRSSPPPTNPLATASGHPLCDEVWDISARIFARPPAVECQDDFEGVNERYTYEALRLTGRAYAMALAHEMPFSKAAHAFQTQSRNSSRASSASQDAPSPQQLPGAAHPDETNTPMHILIMSALLRTDMTRCWGHLAGVLFFISVVGSACGNPEVSPAWLSGRAARATSELSLDFNDVTSAPPPQSSAPLRQPLPPAEQEYEDARKVLSAISVRCTILLSFEFGGAILETLRRIVGIEQALAKAENERQIRTATAFTNSSGKKPRASYTPSVDHDQASLDQMYPNMSRAEDRYSEQPSIYAVTPPKSSPPVFYGPEVSRQHQLGFGDFAHDFLYP